MDEKNMARISRAMIQIHSERQDRLTVGRERAVTSRIPHGQMYRRRAAGIRMEPGRTGHRAAVISSRQRGMAMAPAHRMERSTGTIHSPDMDLGLLRWCSVFYHSYFSGAS